MNILKDMLGSRKWVIFLVTFAAYAANGIGQWVDEPTLDGLIALVIGILVAQGVADHGSQGLTMEAKRAARAGLELGEPLIKVLRESDEYVEISAESPATPPDSA